MIPINQFLTRFKNLTNTDKVKKQLIIELLANKKISLTVNQLSISKNTLFIKTSPIIKTEILLNEEEILKEIRKTPSLYGISSIL